MKLKITNVTVEDAAGKYGPQKKIKFTDEGGRTISGWVSVKAYNPEQWKVGMSTPEIEVTQNGNFWNFKLPSNSPAAQATAQTTQGIAQVLALCTEMNDRLKNIEGKVLPVAVNSTHPFES